MSRKIWLGLVVAATALLLAVAGLVFLTPSEKPVPVPSPNGYDAFLAAAKKLRKDDFSYEKASVLELRTRLQGDQEALEQVRAGLRLQSRVPPTDASKMDEQLQEAGSFKALARVLEAEARLKTADARYTEAAHSGIDMLHLAHASSRGGPLIFAMVGLAIENRGLSVIEKAAPHLDQAARARLIPALRQIQAERETVAAISENERAWVRQVHGAKGTFVRLLTRKQLQATERKFAGLHQAVETRTKNLITLLEKNPGEAAKPQALE